MAEPLLNHAEAAGETAVRMLDEAGFDGVRVERIEHDIQNNWYLAGSR